MFRSKHERCEFKVAPPAPFPVTEVPARNLRKGMTLVALPQHSRQREVTVCCGHWPVIADDPSPGTAGVVDPEPCVSWSTDEPGRDCRGPRYRYYWTPPDLLVTVAVGRPAVR